MATAVESGSSDREEGEIVDEFEDISDNSIILPLSGKCDKSKDHLPPISLSSVSEDEFDKHHRHHHRFHGHHHHHHHGKMFKKRKMKMKIKMRSSKKKFHHRKGFCSDSHSSDNDFIKLDSKLLKAAIRINDHECLKNSLRSRLKGMTNLNDGHPLDNQEDAAKSSDQKVDQELTSDEGDNELINLRLEALRTAVYNKYQRRKKRKIKEVHESDNLTEISIKIDDKENSENPNLNAESIAKKPCPESIENKKESDIIIDSNNIPPEDDEDVLRALLLASMSKKITREPTKELEIVRVKTAIPLGNNNPNSNQVKSFSVPLDSKIINNVNKQVISNPLSNNTHKINKKNRINSHPIKHTKVKPIIININDDSDSEEELKNKTKKDTAQLNVIENTVEKFLKEQRAKVEAEEMPPKKKSNSHDSEIFQKSAVKLLPKFKQIEYQKLLRQLQEKNALSPRIKRSSYKTNGEAKQTVPNSKKIIKNKAAELKMSSKSNDTKLNKFNNTKLNNKFNKTKLNKLHDKKLNESVDIADDARALQKAFKEMQTPTNGRLQMQAQYKVLTPVVKKIDDVSAERKKCNREVKRLLEELTIAKKKLRETHINFKKYVHELLEKKEEIDKRPRKQKNDKELPITSTPLKDKNTFQSFSASSISKISDGSPPISAPVFFELLTNTSKVEEKFDENDINPGDPNDIDKIYKKGLCTIPMYISPLDNINRANVDDPFSIMCPYDIDGNCRDPECVFQHYRT